ncbi:MAG: DUF1846 family protein [Patescibacteria group bacterium]|nr:DUF1846 family protein [Patescibacteria group bacterium]
MIRATRGFDTERYIEAQATHMRSRLAASNSNPVFMEFGGKPFGDHHAERVLPGYDADCKARLLSALMPVGKIVMVVNARDILLPDYGRTLQGRRRGDSQLRYDDETIRLIRRARELAFEIKDVVVSVTPKQPNDRDRRALDDFRLALFREGVTMQTHYEVDRYPDTSVLDNAQGIFGENDIVAEAGNHLIAFSPGGGSGKFGVLLSEMYHALRRGDNPNFIKFETFPVFSADPQHALNLAFEAATADLQNRIVSLCLDTGEATTTYDKDVENYALLRRLFSIYGAGLQNPVDAMGNPTAMSVNKIMDGITDDESIIEACRQEIRRRIRRYETEVALGIEKPTTLRRAREVHDIFIDKYGK